MCYTDLIGIFRRSDPDARIAMTDPAREGVDRWLRGNLKNGAAAGCAGASYPLRAGRRCAMPTRAFLIWRDSRGVSRDLLRGLAENGVPAVVRTDLRDAGAAGQSGPGRGRVPLPARGRHRAVALPQRRAWRSWRGSGGSNASSSTSPSWWSPGPAWRTSPTRSPGGVVQLSFGEDWRILYANRTGSTA